MTNEEEKEKREKQKKITKILKKFPILLEIFFDTYAGIMFVEKTQTDEESFMEIANSYEQMMSAKEIQKLYRDLVQLWNTKFLLETGPEKGSLEYLGADILDSLRDENRRELKEIQLVQEKYLME